MNGWYNEVKHLTMSRCDFLEHDIYDIGIVEQLHVRTLRFYILHILQLGAQFFKKTKSKNVFNEYNFAPNFELK